ncbi:MAG: BON domain-containing protein [Sulfuriferula sp.]|nr:BON domain-containing protein [Sulfuriferula sp.]
MNISQNLKLAAVSMALAFGLSACDKPGPAETAGKNVDQAASAAGAKIDETAKNIDDKLDTQSDKAAVAMDDTTITTKVKAAIFAEPGLKTLKISVDTVNGIVTLSGSADSQADSEKAVALANAVAGVKDVNNQLKIN